jgi:hypothetical protein
MPIRLKCSCGKVLSVKDELAGKGVKCPGCQKVIRVPVPGGAPATSGNAAATSGKAGVTSKSAKPGTAPGRPPAVVPGGLAGEAAIPGGDGGMLDDLFHEAGFQLRTGKTCPSCHGPLAADAVFCTQCGFHLETGAKVKAHVAGFEDAQSGDAILRKAARDMELSQKMQDKMNSGAGMPWWMLSLVLFLLVSVTAVGVISVNLAKREDTNSDFNAVKTLLMLAGIATSAVGIGAYAVVLYRACMESVREGLLSLFVPLYIVYYGFSRFGAVGKTLIVAILALGTSAGLFIAAGSR